MLDVVEPLQVEIPIFLNGVLKKYLLDWTKQSGELTEAEYAQATDIRAMRQFVREESARIRGE